MASPRHTLRPFRLAVQSIRYSSRTTTHRSFHSARPNAAVYSNADKVVRSILLPLVLPQRWRTRRILNTETDELSICVRHLIKCLATRKVEWSSSTSTPSSSPHFTFRISTSTNIVYVSYSWCQPCRMFSPILEKFAAEPNTSANGLPVDLVKIDTESDEGQGLAQQHKVK